LNSITPCSLHLGKSGASCRCSRCIGKWAACVCVWRVWVWVCMRACACVLVRARVCVCGGGVNRHGQFWQYLGIFFPLWIVALIPIRWKHVHYFAQILHAISFISNLYHVGSCYLCELHRLDSGTLAVRRQVRIVSCSTESSVQRRRLSRSG
jgi:hypothetical protein